MPRIVGSHGPCDGEAAHGQVNGLESCWLLVFMGHVMEKLPMVR